MKKNGKKTGKEEIQPPIYRWHDCLCRNSEGRQTHMHTDTNKQTIDTTNSKLDGSKRNCVEWKIQSQKVM